jgi:hypothetical protein
VLASYNGELIAGGSFSRSGDAVVWCIARWDGASWQPIGGGLHGDPVVGPWPAVDAIAVFRGDLIATGLFPYAERFWGLEVHNIARWEGTSWHPLGAGLNDRGSALAVYGNDLVVAGRFTEVGGITVNHVARWDGNAWHPMGDGLPGVADHFVLYDGRLVAAGLYHIMCWDGVSWTQLGEATADLSSDIVVHRDTLFANMVYWDDPYRRVRVARWNETTWTPIGDSPRTDGLGDVCALAVYNDHLIAAGQFEWSNPFLRHIARWNGTAFEGLGSGLAPQPLWPPPPAVRDLLVFNGSLYVGGRFGYAGGKPSMGIARWDDTITPVAVQDFEARLEGGRVELAWRIGPRSLHEICSLRVQRARTQIGPYEDRTQRPLAAQVDMSFTDSDLAGSTSWWYRLAVQVSSGEEQVVGPLLVSLEGSHSTTFLYPAVAPADGGPVIIRYRLGFPVADISLQVFSVHGRLVRNLVREAASPGTYLRSWDRRDESGESVGRGVYLLRLTDGARNLSTKVVLPHR